MELTAPLTPTQLQAAYPRDTRNMSAAAGGELEILLRLEERALRSQFGVTTVDAATNKILADAMLAAWPSFFQQLRQVASETAGADSHSVTYNRSGVVDFAFPHWVGAMLAGVADSAEIPGVPSYTQLTR